MENETDESLRICNSMVGEYAEIVMNRTKEFGVLKSQERQLTVGECVNGQEYFKPHILDPVERKPKKRGCEKIHERSCKFITSR